MFGCSSMSLHSPLPGSQVYFPDSWFGIATGCLHHSLNYKLPNLPNHSTDSQLKGTTTAVNMCCIAVSRVSEHSKTHEEEPLLLKAVPLLTVPAKFCKQNEKWTENILE